MRTSFLPDRLRRRPRATNTLPDAPTPTVWLPGSGKPTLGDVVGTVGAVSNQIERVVGTVERMKALDAPARSIGSRRSRASLWSCRSLGSVVSVASALSIGSAGSVASVGSFLSIGSVGSAVSIGSVGSMLSIGATGRFCSIGARTVVSPEAAATTVTVAALISVAAGALGFRSTRL